MTLKAKQKGLDVSIRESCKALELWQGSLEAVVHGDPWSF